MSDDDAIEAIRALYSGEHHAAPPGSVVAHVRTLLATLDDRDREIAEWRRLAAESVGAQIEADAGLSAALAEARAEAQRERERAERLIATMEEMRAARSRTSAHVATLVHPVQAREREERARREAIEEAIARIEAERRGTIKAADVVRDLLDEPAGEREG